MSSFFLKRKIILCFYNALLFCALGVSAYSAEPVAPTSYALLNTPTGAAAAYAGAGVAAPSDFSALDTNPALLPALERKYTLFGSAAGHKELELWEAGVVDNASSPVAAAVRVRQTVPPGAESKDRQIEGAMGYRLPGTFLSLGIGAAYEQYQLPDSAIQDNANLRVNLGMLYQWNAFHWRRPIFLGFAIRDLFDEYSPIVFDLGASTTFGQGFYTLSLDVVFDDEEGPRSVVVGSQISANTYLDFKGSLGLTHADTAGKQDVIFGLGMFIKTPVLQLFATVSQNDLRDDIAYGAGVALAFNF